LLHLQDGPKNQLDVGADNSTVFLVRKKTATHVFSAIYRGPKNSIYTLQGHHLEGMPIKSILSIIICAKMGVSPIVGTLSFKAKFPLNHD